MWMTLTSSTSPQYPTDGRGGSSTTSTSSMYAPPTITFSGQPSDAETVTIPAYSAGGRTFLAKVFEFDNNAAVTAGNVTVTIGASAAATCDALAAAINAQTECGFTATSDGATLCVLTPKIVDRNALVRLAETATNVTAFSPTNLRYLRATRAMGFQPRNSAAAATGSVAVAQHVGTAVLTQPSSTAGTETLPYQPIGPNGATLNGPGLRATASATGIVGTLYFEDDP